MFGLEILFLKLKKRRILNKIRRLKQSNVTLVNFILHRTYNLGSGVFTALYNDNKEQINKLKIQL